MNIWTPTVSEADRRLLAAHGPALLMQQENRDPATNKVDGDERHMGLSCDLHMYTDISISTFTRVNGHMCTRVHMHVHAHTALIKIKQ